MVLSGATARLSLMRRPEKREEETPHTLFPPTFCPLLSKAPCTHGPRAALCVMNRATAALVVRSQVEPSQQAFKGMSAIDHHSFGASSFAALVAYQMHTHPSTQGEAKQPGRGKETPPSQPPVSREGERAAPPPSPWAIMSNKIRFQV